MSWPTSIHSACPLVPFLTVSTSSVNLSSVHVYFTPWKIAVGTGSFWNGPTLSFATNVLDYAGFLDFY